MREKSPFFFLFVDFCIIDTKHWDETSDESYCNVKCSLTKEATVDS